MSSLFVSFMLKWNETISERAERATGLRHGYAGFPLFRVVAMDSMSFLPLT